ncbi:MAG: hypothetical protein ACPG7F_09295 [Aggregatilineales bacterium]
MTAPLPLPQIEQQSVQVLPDASKDGNPGFFIVSPRGNILPARATRQREWTLREWYRTDEQWMIRGAFSGLAKKIAALPYEIAGDETGAYNREYFQSVFNEADFGRGMATLLLKIVLDFLRQDTGGFIELIAPGDPAKAPTGAVTGIAYLDTLRCIPTGDPEYPVVYCDRNSKYHRMHFTRIIQIQDMPDGDETQPGYGDSALSRAIAIASRQLNTTRYIGQFLDDKPAPGVGIASGIMQSQLMAAFAKTQQARDTADLPTYGDMVFLYGMDASMPADLKIINWSKAPEKFDWKTYTDIDINALALAMNVDVQELWQLVGQSMGSGQQSEILHQKSRGKTIGYLLTTLTRAFNSILPDGFQFAFKYLDEEEATQEAEKAQTWSGTINQLRPYLPDVVLTQLAINQIEAVADAFTDVDEGRGRSDDVDSDPVNAEVVEDTDDAPEPEDAPDDDTEGAEKAVKSIQATRLDFESRFASIQDSLRLGEIDRRRAGLLLRGTLRTFGSRAYRDGLIDGGVADGTMDDDDTARFNLLLAQQSQYVSNFTAAVRDGQVTDAMAFGKPELWFNKSLQPFYDAGRLSADKNGNYLFLLGNTEQHCPDCKRLNGQIHRLKTYFKRGLYPRSSALACGGWRCDCRLIKTTEPAKGRF